MTFNYKRVSVVPIKNSKIFVLALCLFASGSIYSQNQKISIPKGTTTLQKVFQEIEKQTNMSVDYNQSKFDINKKIETKGQQKSLSSTLDEVLSGSGLTYKIEDGHILIIPMTDQQGQIKSDQSIKGVVTDNSGEPIIGANISVKGSTIGTVTDINGQFSLNVPGNASILVSYIGYLPQEVRVGNKRDFSFVLKEDTKVLDEVVVIGYGTTSTRKMASAVTAVKGEKLQDLPFNDMSSTLQGRATGVIVQNQGGEPGSNSKISIRGGGDPVYVIDGVISTSWEFNTLNPVDIESLSVLKDAASLAVYGSRAADGIILVKTKQGSQGKTSITYTFNAEYSQPTTLIKKMDAYTYADTQNRAAMYDGLPAFHQYSEEEMNKILNQTDPLYPDVDWLDLGLKNFAPQYRHGLSMNGSGKLVNYYLSLGMIDQGSLFTSNALDYNRYTIRSNVNTTFDKIGLTVGLNLNGAIEKKTGPM